MVLKGRAFLFVIDILHCAVEGYATIENRYSYDSIESLKESGGGARKSRVAGKDYIYIVIKPNAEGQRKKLLFYVSNRDECMAELRKRLQKE